MGSIADRHPEPDALPNAVTPRYPPHSGRLLTLPRETARWRGSTAQRSASLRGGSEGIAVAGLKGTGPAAPAEAVERSTGRTGRQRARPARPHASPPAADRLNFLILILVSRAMRFVLYMYY